MSDVVLLKTLSHQLGVDRSHLRKLALRLNVKTTQVRDAGTGNQLTLAVSKDDAARITKWRQDHGFSGAEVAKRDEFLYAVQPDPELRPTRVKLGCSNDTDSRFSTYRTIAPDLVVLRIWNVPKAAEGFLLALGAAYGVQIGTEIFEIDELDEFLDKADNALGLISSQSMD